jgi:hypothetical protein
MIRKNKIQIQTKEKAKVSYWMKMKEKRVKNKRE